MDSVQSLEDLVSLATRVPEQFGSEVWWRGQADYDNFLLVPGAFRHDRDQGYEATVARRFRIRAQAYIEKTPDKSDWSGWLFLMQHHRLPTRLLDWTESPFAAIYFAVHELDNRPGAIYALSPTKLNLNFGGAEKLILPDSDVVAPLFEAPFKGPLPHSEAVYAVLPWLLHIRMVAQRSVMTIHDSLKPLEENEKNKQCLIKYKIPQKSKYHIRKQLIRSGITRTSLFPELDSLASEIKNMYL